MMLVVGCMGSCPSLLLFVSFFNPPTKSSYIGGLYGMWEKILFLQFSVKLTIVKFMRPKKAHFKVIMFVFYWADSWFSHFVNDLSGSCISLYLLSLFVHPSIFAHLISNQTIFAFFLFYYILHKKTIWNCNFHLTNSCKVQWRSWIYFLNNGTYYL